MSTYSWAADLRSREAAAAVAWRNADMNMTVAGPNRRGGGARGRGRRELRRAGRRRGSPPRRPRLRRRRSGRTRDAPEQAERPADADAGDRRGEEQVEAGIAALVVGCHGVLERARAQLPGRWAWCR